MSDNVKLTASEAVFGVLSWLTCRSELLTIGSTEDCAIVAELAGQFCDENNLDLPRDNWQNNLIHPSGECSGPTE